MHVEGEEGQGTTSYYNMEEVRRTVLRLFFQHTNANNASKFDTKCHLPKKRKPINLSKIEEKNVFGSSEK
jgi:hypothetical protein